MTLLPAMRRVRVVSDGVTFGVESLPRVADRDTAIVFGHGMEEVLISAAPRDYFRLQGGFVGSACRKPRARSHSSVRRCGPEPTKHWKVDDLEQRLKRR